MATVAAVRSMIGPKIALMGDCNRSLDPAEAGRRLARLAEYDPHWTEERGGSGGRIFSGLESYLRRGERACPRRHDKRSGPGIEREATAVARRAY
ncbi:MAG TPA: enolase C-terminal domain-like protein [Alphaproteobacteria bacterium]